MFLSIYTHGPVKFAGRYENAWARDKITLNSLPRGRFLASLGIRVILTKYQSDVLIYYNSA